MNGNCRHEDIQIIIWDILITINNDKNSSQKEKNQEVISENKIWRRRYAKSNNEKHNVWEPFKSSVFWFCVHVELFAQDYFYIPEQTQYNNW